MAHVRGDSTGRRGPCVRAVCLIGLAVSGGILTAPASAWESDAALNRLWFIDLVAPSAELQRDASDGSRDLVTLEDAVALALQANHLVKSTERLQFITESVKRAYAGAVEAHQSLVAREERLRAALGVERLVEELARQGRAAPPDVLHARVALAQAMRDLRDARSAFAIQSRQLNHLMGRDLQARVRVRSESDVAPLATLRGGAAAMRRE